MTDANGQVKEFRAADATDRAIRSRHARTMDCIDCHNTVGHPISPTAEKAVDEAIAAGLVSRDASVRAARRGPPGEGVVPEPGCRAARRSTRGLRGVLPIEAAAPINRPSRAPCRPLQDLYRRNVFPTMKVTWGSYPDNRGHITSTGCFRCHDDSHTARTARRISGDCELCHKEITK